MIRYCSKCGDQVDSDHPGTVQKDSRYYHGGCIPIKEQHERIADRNGTKICPKCFSYDTVPDATPFSSFSGYDCKNCGHHFQ